MHSSMFPLFLFATVVTAAPTFLEAKRDPDYVVEYYTKVYTLSVQTTVYVTPGATLSPTSTAVSAPSVAPVAADKLSNPSSEPTAVTSTASTEAISTQSASPDTASGHLPTNEQVSPSDVATTTTASSPAKAQITYSGSAPDQTLAPQVKQVSTAAHDTSFQDETTATSNGVSDSKYPFSRVVAFGDSLTDNGNGSYAHCVQAGAGDCDNSIYGFRTWTDGPVAVSYLVDLLGVPLTEDYAFGWAQGGSKMGATIEDSYDQTQYAQTGSQQVDNYTSNADLSSIGDTLHFLWIGNNDINLYHLSTATFENPTFASEMSSMMLQLVDKLFDAGAGHVFVPGLYAKHLAPAWKFLASTSLGREMLGAAIQQANTAIETALVGKYGDKVIYYDVFSRMVDIWNDHDSYGITMVGDNFCDGYSQADWDACVTNGHGNTFYWMQYTDMTTTVHRLIAQDMFDTIDNHFS